MGQVCLDLAYKNNGRPVIFLGGQLLALRGSLRMDIGMPCALNLSPPVG